MVPVSEGNEDDELCGMVARLDAPRSLLHPLGKKHGLLLHFAKTTLEVKRVAAARFELKAV